MDPDETVGDFSKAFKELNWEPRVSFEELIRLMVVANFANFKVNTFPLAV